MDTIEARKKSNINQERRKQPETCTLFQTELIHNLSTNDFYSLNLTLTTAILVPNKLFIIILVILSFLSLKSPILSLTNFLVFLLLVLNTIINFVLRLSSGICPAREICAGQAEGF